MAPLFNPLIAPGPVGAMGSAPLGMRGPAVAPSMTPALSTVARAGGMGQPDPAMAAQRSAFLTAPGSGMVDIGAKTPLGPGAMFAAFGQNLLQTALSGRQQQLAMEQREREMAAAREAEEAERASAAQREAQLGQLSQTIMAGGPQAADALALYSALGGKNAAGLGRAAGLVGPETQVTTHVAAPTISTGPAANTPFGEALGKSVAGLVEGLPQQRQQAYDLEDMASKIDRALDSGAITGPGGDARTFFARLTGIDEEGAAGRLAIAEVGMARMGQIRQNVLSGATSDRDVALLMQASPTTDKSEAELRAWSAGARKASQYNRAYYDAIEESLANPEHSQWLAGRHQDYARRTADAKFKDGLLTDQQRKALSGGGVVDPAEITTVLDMETGGGETQTPEPGGASAVEIAPPQGNAIYQAMSALIERAGGNITPRQAAEALIQKFPNQYTLEELMPAYSAWQQSGGM